MLPPRAVQGDVATLFAANIIIMLVAFSLYKILPSMFGQSAFYEYSLAKRFQAFALPLSLCGLGTVLPRDIVRCREKAQAYFAAGILVVGFSLMATLAISLVIWHYAMTLEEKWGIYLVFLFLCVPPLLSGLFFSYFRGMGEIRNGVFALLVFNLLTPVVAVVLSGSLREFAAYNAALSGFAALAYARTIFRGVGSPAMAHFRPYAPKLAIEGLARVPGDAFFQLLLTAPVLISAQYSDVESAGTVAFMIATLTLMAFPLKPLSTVLLTEVAKSSSVDRARRIFQRVVIATALMGSIVCGVFFLASGHYFAYFGLPMEPGSAGAFCLAAFGYIVYIAVRSFVDALGATGAPSVAPSMGLFAFIAGYFATSAAGVGGANSVLIPLAIGNAVMATSALIMAGGRLGYRIRK